jgi:hypothetical protein
MALTAARQGLEQLLRMDPGYISVDKTEEEMRTMQAGRVLTRRVFLFRRGRACAAAARRPCLLDSCE